MDKYASTQKHEPTKVLTPIADPHIGRTAIFNLVWRTELRDLNPAAARDEQKILKKNIINLRYKSQIQRRQTISFLSKSWEEPSRKGDSYYKQTVMQG